jgi:nitrate/nitrite transport system substrate-binding protein
MLTGLSLDLNGNAVTVSEVLHREMLAVAGDEVQEASAAARALAAVVRARRLARRPPLTFATVFTESSHNLLLRYWMASAGIDPDRDLRLVVVPPPQMVNHLRAGTVAGFCVGEPWNSHAVSAGIGRILVTSYDIWNNHPEKVLGVTRLWADAHPNTHDALIAALLEACMWLDEDSKHRIEVARLLSMGRYVNAPQDVLEASLTGSLRFVPDQPPLQRPDFNVFHRYAANHPWRSHALWYLVQMQRWDLLGREVDCGQVARSVYRPDLYRRAAARLGVAAPEADLKCDGVHLEDWVLGSGASSVRMGPDWFIDDRVFDPRDLSGYLARLSGRSDDAAAA